MAERNALPADPLADANGRRSGDAPDSISAILEAQQAGQTMVADAGDDDDGFMLGHPAEEPDEEPAPAEEEPPSSVSEEEPAPQEPAEAPGEEAPQLHFQSQEEAERAWMEARRALDEGGQERSLLERRLELLEREIVNLRHPVEPEPEPVAEVPAPPPFDIKAHWRQTYARIDQLDPDDDNYEDQRLDILAEAHSREAEELNRTTEFRARQVGQEAAQRVVDQSTEERRNTRVRQKLLDKAAAAGLDVALPSTDNPLGGAHLNDLQAAVEYRLYPLDADEDTAIDAVVGLVAKRHNVAPAAERPGREPRNTPAERVDVTPPESRNGIQRAQALNTPMERAGTGRPVQAPREEDTRPMTMEEALNATLEQRTIRR